MPKLMKKLPSYRLHKPTGQAVVTLSGRDHYWGKFGTPNSHNKYQRLIGEWSIVKTQQDSNSIQSQPPHDLRICELFIAYIEFSQTYYVKDGKQTGEATNITHAMRGVVQLYQNCRISEFGPRALKHVRNLMVKDELSRKVVNARVNRIRRVFKWGVENELVEPNVLQALQAISPLKCGRTEARELPAVLPVPEDYINAVRPHVSRQVEAMIDLQLLTGMRPGEVVLLRSSDIDMASRPWVYHPRTHKTVHHGKKRIIYIGPQAQVVIQPFIRSALSQHLFRPLDAIHEFNCERRKVARFCNKQYRRRRKPLKTPGEHYTTASYGHAINSACGKANIPCWGPNRLRHNAATFLRKEFGLEAARVILGHTSAAVTEVYAELDRTKAAEIMVQVG